MWSTPSRLRLALAGGVNIFRAAAVPAGSTGGRVRPDDAELGGEHDLVAAVADRATDQLLVVPLAVDVGGVEQVDAQVERPMDRRDPLGVTDASVGARHGHAPEADRRDPGAV